jgi:hypothetical protein
MEKHEGSVHDALRRVIEEQEAEIERLRAERNALRRWAKAAGNAYRDVMQTLVSKTAAIQALHPDDWKRAKNWATEICSAREAAEKARDT